jgi:hypothetical protein
VLGLAPHPAFRAWASRVAAQPGFLAERLDYTIDPPRRRSWASFGKILDVGTSRSI